VEEWQNPECGFDEHHRPQRFFDTKHEEKLAEVFPNEMDRTYKHNVVFDYTKPAINAKYIETHSTGKERMMEFIRQLNDHLKVKEDPRKVVIVIVSHGFFVDTFAHSYGSGYFAGKYCCTHFAEIIKADEGKHPELNVLVLGHYAYK